MRLSQKIEILKKDILGKKYSLSVGFVDEARSRSINHKYRGKNKPTNVLSFALHRDEGELVLCKNVIKQEAKLQKRGFNNWLIFLLVHGMLHLKGFDHSPQMEKLENKHFARAKIFKVLQ